MASIQQQQQLLQVALQNAQSLNGGVLPGVPDMYLDPSTKHARKIYVGNLPVTSTEQSLKNFFNEALESLLPTKQPGPSVVSCYLNLQRRFAFLEHRTIDEANFTLGLDGIQFSGHALKLRRPQDYNPTLAEVQMGMVRVNGFEALCGASATLCAEPTKPVASAIPPSDLVAGALGIISTTVDDSPNKVFIGGLPHHLTEIEVKQILSTFGPLKSFHLVKAQPTMAGEAEKSKGFAFCEWRDPSITDAACLGLNGMRIGDRTLNVRRAVPHAVHKASTLGVTPQQALAMGLAGMPQPNAPLSPVGILPTVVSQQPPIGKISRVIAIRNMIPPVVSDPSVVDDTLAEAEVECSAVSKVRSVQAHGDQILVEFSSTKSAVKALKHLNGRSFDGRILVCAFAEPTSQMRAASVQRIVTECNEEYEQLLKQHEANEQS